ncbi:MAG: hypothetical protein ACREXT_08090 [Gammaproteobacteria bacterium]
MINPDMPVDPDTSLQLGVIARQIAQSGVFSRVALYENRWPISVVVQYREEEPPEGRRAGDIAQGIAAAATIGLVPNPNRKIYIVEVDLVFNGVRERHLTYKEDVTLQQGMLTGDPRKQKQPVVERLVKRFLDEVKGKNLLP